jgi:hypothetical protein
MEFAATIVAPLGSAVVPMERCHTNGTAFFFETKDALFGVTAAHVIEGQKAGTSIAIGIPVPIGVLSVSDPPARTNANMRLLLEEVKADADRY